MQVAAPRLAFRIFPHFSATHLHTCEPMKAYHFDPGTLKQRILRRITLPVIPQIKVDEGEKYSKKKEEIRLRTELHPFRLFLQRQCLEEIFVASEKGMLVVCDRAYHKNRDVQPLRIAIHKLGGKLHTFPWLIVRNSTKGTKWERFVDQVQPPYSSNFFIILPETSPILCSKVIRLVSKVHFLQLLGGIVGHRIMNKSELVAFGDINPDVEHHLAVAVSTLEAVIGNTSLLLQQPLQELSMNLQQLSQTNEPKS